MNVAVIFLIDFVRILMQIIFWAILISVLMSWFAAGRSPLGSLLDQIVRPILRPFRWARIGMFDLSPIAALFCLRIAEGLLIATLHSFL